MRKKCCNAAKTAASRGNNVMAVTLNCDMGESFGLYKV
ncbi:lactam utilization protein LamB, partial [Mesorhizobium sp. M7A.F.Ca.CA.003.01.2.1]